MRYKIVFFVFILLLISTPGMAIVLELGPEVPCCWYLTGEEHGGASEDACNLVDAEELDCEQVLSDWERAQDEWLREQENLTPFTWLEDIRTISMVLAFLATIILVLASLLLIKSQKNKQRKDSTNKLHKCKECGLHYENKDLSKECEKWCKKHHTCNLEIIKHAVENYKTK